MRPPGSLRDLRGARPSVRYVIGLAIASAALAMTALAEPLLHRPPSSPLFAAVVVIAWLVGLGPASLAAVAGIVVADRLGEAVIGVWWPNVRDGFWMLLFVAIALGMAWLASGVRRLVDERAAALRRERAARLDAEAANHAKDEFLAIVSHELRSPLTAILGWLAVLRRRPPDDAETARALETIERNTRLQARLIDDLLDVSRASVGKLDVVMRHVDLGDVVRHSLSLLEPKARAAGLVMETAIDAGLPVYGDATRLQQVLINFVSNAVKFTPPGGRLRVEARRDGDVARLAVVDSGIGIDPHVLPHIFERFYQAPGTSRSREGLGLGLAIARHVVELHAGSIGAYSAGPGLGASFTVTLPLDER